MARGEGHPGEGEGSGGRVTAEARGGWLGAAVPLAPSTPASTAGGAEDLGSEEEDDARRRAEEDDAHAGDRAEDTHDGGPRAGREGDISNRCFCAIVQSTNMIRPILILRSLLFYT